MSRNNSASFLFSSNSNNINHSTEGEFSKSKDSMGSDLFQNHSQQPQSCGLARYRSAPGSFLSTLLESNPDNGSSGDESEAFFSDFMNNGNLDLNQKNDGQLQYFLKREVVVGTELRPGKDVASAPNMRMGYEGSVNGGGGAVVGSYSIGMESQVLGKGNNGGANLARQNSSPGGFFSGFNVMGETGNYRVQNHAESNRMKFSPAPSSTSRFMPSIPESGSESIQTRSPVNDRIRNSTGVTGREFDAPFPHDSWNDNPPFNSLKRTRDCEPKFSNFGVLENSNEETEKKSSGLVCHLSLPKASSSVANSQKFLHFQQETVPCQIRAKRGFATHPRSIAERMRRTRISDKMKKLQDLFPNIDKQTNTADMLDMAVDYIKDLQKQVKTLNHLRDKCICLSKVQPTSTT